MTHTRVPLIVRLLFLGVCGLALAERGWSEEFHPTNPFAESVDEYPNASAHMKVSQPGLSSDVALPNVLTKENFYEEVEGNSETVYENVIFGNGAPALPPRNTVAPVVRKNVCREEEYENIHSPAVISEKELEKNRQIQRKKAQDVIEGASKFILGKKGKLEEIERRRGTELTLLFSQALVEGWGPKKLKNEAGKYLQDLPNQGMKEAYENELKFCLASIKSPKIERFKKLKATHALTTKKMASLYLHTILGLEGKNSRHASVRLLKEHAHKLMKGEGDERMRSIFYRELVNNALPSLFSSEKETIQKQHSILEFILGTANDEVKKKLVKKITDKWKLENFEKLSSVLRARIQKVREAAL